MRQLIAGPDQVIGSGWEVAGKLMARWIILSFGFGIFIILYFAYPAGGSADPFPKHCWKYYD